MIALKIEHRQLSNNRPGRENVRARSVVGYWLRIAHDCTYRLLLSFALATYLISGAVSAQENVLEIIALEHALANDMLPLIAPFVSPEGSATGMHNQLIIKSSPANIAEIKQLLEAFDRAPKSLRITVRQDVSGASNIQEHALSGRKRSGDVTAGVVDPGLHRGARIGVRDSNGNAVQYRSVNTHSTKDNHNSHFVTAVEGRPALIQTGQSIPVPYSAATYGSFGGVVAQGIDYRDASSGFYVTARTNGQLVTLDVAPQLENADPRNRGAIDTRYSSTSVSGRLGEWISLGGANDNRTGSGRRLLASTRHHDANIYGVWMKVEQID
ncbi:MAG: hypothetical protein VCB59_07460 [Gammaproteobacteria bacterium]